MTIETVGYIGAGLLALCALPQMIMTLKDGHARGISSLFLLSWYIGEILMFYFLVMTSNERGPLFYNYLINVIMLTVIVKYKYWERKPKLGLIRRIDD